MSLTTDVRAYADAAIDVAVEQAKQALEAAHASLGKLQNNVKSIDALGPQAEGLREAIEPYLLTALGYGNTLASRVEAVVTDLRNDKRFANVIEGTEAFATAVVGAVQDRLTKAAGSAAVGASAVQEVVQDRVSKVAESAASGAAFVRAGGAKRGKPRPSTSGGSAGSKPATTKPSASTASAKTATTKPAAAKSTKAAGTKSAKATGTKATAAKATAAKAPATSAAKRAPAKRAPAKKASAGPVSNHTAVRAASNTNES